MSDRRRESVTSNMKSTRPPCRRTSALLPLILLTSRPLQAQMPFYTDDTDVTAPGILHIEAFDEVDALQSTQFPDLRQNTANIKINFGLPHGLELDLDAPYLSIYRAAGSRMSRGVGDTDMGVKWETHQASPATRVPAFAVSFYVEFPTGNTRQELGSGLTDYWLNFIVQQPISGTTRINLNLGILFAGNTSTGVVGIETTRGQVFTGGISLLHDVSPKLTVGGELYGGISDNSGLDRTQLQAMLGAQFTIRDGMTLCAGLIGGEYAASPRIGGQIGIAIDFPEALGRFGRKLAGVR
jgi:Putative MetA-pathway of phenol degradation